ncbi:sulfite exporter TauE/SafE family protein [Glaciecola sp. MH2013]|nr:sulfite exporter TauE/SafE family protein [Glaciecola sp. MH2013]
MCGGIASAFSFAIPKNSSASTYIIAYNLGRIASYTMAGAITGYLGSLASSAIYIGLPILQAISIIFLVLLALYISDWYKGLSYLERLGSHIWRIISPLSKRFIPFRTPLSAVAYGAIWGWLPCGLVYSMLTWSLASESAVDGALFMLFFGFGTLPAVMATSLGASFLLPLLQHRKTRQIIAAFLLAFSLFLTYALITGNN